MATANSAYHVTQGMVRKDDTTARPVNAKPDGIEINGPAETKINISHTAPMAIEKYKKKTWVWVSTANGLVPEGSGVGKQTILIDLDGELIGWLPVATAKRLKDKIGKGIAASRAFIDDQGRVKLFL